MLRTRYAALFLALAAAVCAQGPQGRGMRVRGVVTDSYTRQPIPNVRVVLGNGTASATTSANGTYELVITQTGNYNVKVEAQGYQPELEYYTATLDGSSELTGMDMQMYRPGALAGRLVDAETRQPIAGVNVVATLAAYKRGRLSFVGNAGAKITGQDGTFRLEGLRAASYSVLLTPLVAEKLLNSGAALPAERNPEYPRKRLPADGSPGYKVTPGSTLELGDIVWAREPLYRITGVLKGCDRFDDFSRGVQLVRHDGDNNHFGAVAALACEERFTADNLAPGDYSLRMEMQELGQVELGKITVIDRDVEFNPFMPRPLVMEGSIVAPEEFRAQGLIVGFSKGTGAGRRAEGIYVRPERKFEMTRGTTEPVEVTVSGVSAPYYVAEILYNSAPLRDGMLVMNPYAPSQTLVIRVESGGASVAGTVMRNRERVADAAVILVPTPAHLQDGFPVHRQVVASGGTFRFAGLPPGSYKAVAVERAAWERELQKPGVLSALAAGGTQIELGSAASVQISLELKWVAPDP